MEGKMVGKRPRGRPRIGMLEELKEGSSSIPILGLPLGLLPTILPSITSLNSPSPRKTCPIQFFFRCTIVSTNFRLFPTLSSTFSFVILSSQLTFSNLLHSHISKTSKRMISSFHGMGRSPCLRPIQSHTPDNCLYPLLEPYIHFLCKKLLSL